MRSVRRRLSFANVVSLIALFVALSAGAYAAFHLPKNSVRSKNIVNKQVKRPDLKPAEAFHHVGAAGEPQFGRGGQNDCRWKGISGGGQTPPVFYKDPYGVVRLAGLALGEDGPGGDGKCDDSQDATIFRLPKSDRPARQTYLPPVVVIGRKGSPPFPPGAVLATNLSSPQTVVPLDPISFRSAGAGTGLKPKADQRRSSVELGPLRKLLR
jgi:hypothetical protein